MIGLGIFTHSIGAPIVLGVPSAVQDIIRKVCFDGITQKTLYLAGTALKRADFNITVYTDC